ncbi:MAG: DUF4160 domain-containing protein [Longimicrobiales bacterium]
MPTVLRVRGFRFVIYTREHVPANVHVLNADGECRILIHPDIALDERWDMKKTDAREAVRIARENVKMLREKWEEIHGRLE